MAWPPERPARAPAGPDHVGRHRRARARAGLEPGHGSDEEREDLEPHHGYDEERDGFGPGDGYDDEGDDLAPEEGSDGRSEESGTEAEVVPLFSVPDSLRSVDVAVGGRAVRGLLLVAVVLLLSLGGRWWWVNQQAAGVPVEQVVSGGQVGAPPSPSTPEEGAPSATQAPPTLSGESGATSPAGQAGATSEAAAEGGSGASDAHGPAAEAVLVVHVIGQVHEPGVVELPLGSRVIDAVRAAGGVTDEADPASLNLARPVVDGEQVWVGAPGEEPPPGQQAGPPTSPGTVTDGTGSAGGQGGPGLVVDLNLADQAQLEELPGVGPVTAGNILAWREQHGRFTVVEELMEVSGIGEKTFEQLRAHVTVGG